MVDTPLTQAQLDEAEAAFDRLSVLAKQPEYANTAGFNKGNPMSAVGYTSPVYDPTFIQFISHPFFEHVTQQVLRSQRVCLFERGPHERGIAEQGDEPEPTAQEQWEGGKEEGRAEAS